MITSWIINQMVVYVPKDWVDYVQDPSNNQERLTKLALIHLDITQIRKKKGGPHNSYQAHRSNEGKRRYN